MTITFKASARSNPPYGYKAIILHCVPFPHKSRSEVVFRSGHHGIGRNFSSRTEAITYAQAVIDNRKAVKAISDYRYQECQKTGHYPSLEKAKTVLAPNAKPLKP